MIWFSISCPRLWTSFIKMVAAKRVVPVCLFLHSPSAIAAYSAAISPSICGPAVSIYHMTTGRRNFCCSAHSLEKEDVSFGIWEEVKGQDCFLPHFAVARTLRRTFALACCSRLPKWDGRREGRRYTYNSMWHALRPQHCLGSAPLPLFSHNGLFHLSCDVFYRLPPCLCTAAWDVWWPVYG